MSTHKDVSTTKTRKGEERQEKIQTAEGWKRQQAELLKARHPEDVRERKQKAV